MDFDNIFVLLDTSARYCNKLRKIDSKNYRGLCSQTKGKEFPYTTFVETLFYFPLIMKPPFTNHWELQLLITVNYLLLSFITDQTFYKQQNIFQRTINYA